MRCVDGFHRVGDDGMRHRPCLGGDARVFGLGLIDRVQHLVGGRSSHVGDVVEATARIGQPVGGLLQPGHHAHLRQRVVKQPCDGADLQKDLGGRGSLDGSLAEGLGWIALHVLLRSLRVQAVAASFCMIFCTFSSSVALVKGLTM
jgi:hypothetical protein